MILTNTLKCFAATLLGAVLATNANAVVVVPDPDATYSFEFVFSGECDDCAFAGDPADAGFNSIGDGLTETVSATLTLTDVYLSADGFIETRGSGGAVFSYGGSSLINAFTMADPYLFAEGLMPSGAVAPGYEFEFASSVNAADPANPLFFDFPDFCTPLGRDALLLSACDDVGLVHFTLRADGVWSVRGEVPFDIGTGGQLVAASAAVAEPVTGALLGIGLLGLGAARRRSRAA